MAGKDKTTRRLEECNDVFADIINVLVFGGRRIVHEDELLDTDNRSEYHAGDKGLRGQERDVSKLWVRGGVKFALFGLENQSCPDPEMVIRVPNYDDGSYKSQSLDRRAEKTPEDETAPKENTAAASKENAETAPKVNTVAAPKVNTVAAPRESPGKELQSEHVSKQTLSFYPVLTIVLFMGLGHWTAARTLHEALRFPEGLEEYFKKFIPNTPINIFEVAWLDDEVINQFQSDFGHFARFLKDLRIHGKNYLQTLNPGFKRKIVHLLELMHMLSAYSGNPWYEEYAMSMEHKEEVTMLAVMQEAEDMIRAKGEEDGRKEGRKEGKKEGKAEDLVNLMKNFSLSIEQAMHGLSIPETEWAEYRKLVAQLQATH